MKSNLKNRSIYCHDNLEVLQGINSNCIDLIYLDPPFNKKKIFTAPIGSSAEGASFKDIFRKEDIKDEWLQTIKEDYDKVYNFLNGVRFMEGRNSYNFCYLAYMAIRLMECHRILRNTGSLYLHCDSTMSHYLKILLDCIFNEKNFRNNIVWKYNWASTTKRGYAKKHDDILFYSKSNDFLFYMDNIRIPYTDEQLKGYKKDEIGCYTIDNKDKSKKWYANQRGQTADDTFFISIIGRKAKERTGYPTQKPLALLERIIKASSNEGDLILDPFCGCATTCIAAEKLSRQWIGIDVSIKAYELVKERLDKEVANPEDLFQYNNKIYFSTTPPKRTDKEIRELDKKFVYVISHKNYEGEYKVGIAKDWKSRLNAYQTYDPNRNYKMEYYLHTPLFREIEKYIHNTFKNKHEWVNGKLENIIKEIENFENKYF